ncbi:hypothetical protein PTKIN_Ptkin01aG0378800 [Pterospermum kingtungense]
MDSTDQTPKEIKTVPTAQDEDEVSMSWDDDELQELFLKAVISFQKHFQALDSDIIVTSLPKCGTTWLKALTFSIVNRNHFPKEENPLLSLNPHDLVRFFEIDLYLKSPFPDLENNCPYRPRLFATHIPYASLPASIKDSNSKIVYISRNPMDTLISHWFFADKLRAKNVEPLSLDEAFELFCQGILGFGPFFDHVLGYWKASQENPNKILFLQYEDLQEDIISHLKRLAMFLGFPFSEEEEKHGVVEEIANMCSFRNLKGLDVNKNGIGYAGIPQSTLFRKAQVGDWRNYLTPAMVERLKTLIRENFDINSAHVKSPFDYLYEYVKKHFQALESDIIVTSLPKCGTTWLKALTFSIVNRNHFPKEENPLLSLKPHNLVRFFEIDLYLESLLPDLENSCPYRPRLFATHIPYASLPASIKDSNPKIVYISRWKSNGYIDLSLVFH